MNRPTLYIGNKNYSSWSMRPWLALRWAGFPFDEVLIPLGGDGYSRAAMPAVRAISPTGRVPALHVDGLVLTDSLAIVEWAAEQPGANLWPSDPKQRAVARSLVAEMHSGYPAIRRDLSMNIRRRVAAPTWPADTTDDLQQLFRRLEPFFGGWLCGKRSAVDAFYAPVWTRLRTYGVPVPAACERTQALLFADADFQAWEADALREPQAIVSTDSLYVG